MEDGSKRSLCREHGWLSAQLLPSGSTTCFTEAGCAARYFQLMTSSRGTKAGLLLPRDGKLPSTGHFSLGTPPPSVWWRLSCPVMPSRCFLGFPGGSVVKNPPANAGDVVQSLIQEDRTCRGVTKAMSHNYQACALQPGSRNY